MNRRILIFAALLAAATFAQAQQMPPGKWWRRPEVARELELTREQQDKLDESFRGAANDLIDAKADVEKVQVALRGELDRAQLRRTELQRLAAQLTAARGKLFERELMMLVDMRSILDEEQWGKLRHHLDRMQEGRERERGQPMPNRMPNRPQRRRP
jgi:Skp family chaperone for outer membrane proteins